MGPGAKRIKIRWGGDGVGSEAHLNQVGWRWGRKRSASKSGWVAMGPGKTTPAVIGRVVHAQPEGLVTATSGGMAIHTGCGWVRRGLAGHRTVRRPQP